MFKAENNYLKVTIKSFYKMLANWISKNICPQSPAKTSSFLLLCLAVIGFVSMQFSKLSLKFKKTTKIIDSNHKKPQLTDNLPSLTANSNPSNFRYPT